MTRLFAWLRGDGRRARRERDPRVDYTLAAPVQPPAPPRIVNDQPLQGRRRPPQFPNTFRPPELEPGVQRPKVFDPALMHFANGFRVGEPKFADAETARRWRATRRAVMDHVVKMVSESPWAGNLVLRGSLLLKAWLGDAAREPGDMDWVVTPRTIALDSDWSRQFFPDLARMVCDRAAGRIGAEIVAAEVAMDDIWTYERAPGRRVVFPWRAPGLPTGAVQMDVVFGEELLLPPAPTQIPHADGSEGPTVLAAAKELSLAWKILWLETDSYPQGKDLYDAALLAEQTRLPADILLRTLTTPSAGASWLKREEINAELPLRWQVDWDTFRAEYPWVEGDAEDYQRILSDALRRTFAAAS